MEEIKMFLQSLYLGDRFCENIEYNADTFKIQVNCISRIEEGKKEWDFYTNEDIMHGIIVFDDVKDIQYSTNLTLNDEIYEIVVTEKKKDMYTFVVYGCNVNEKGISNDVVIYINAKSVYILDPENNMVIKK